MRTFLARLPVSPRAHLLNLGPALCQRTRRKGTIPPSALSLATP